MKPIAIHLAAALAMALASSTAANSAENCTDLRAEIEAGEATATPQSLAAAFKQALELQDCSDDFRSAVGRKAAIAVYREFQAATEDGGATVEHGERLTKSLTYYRLWQTLASLGEIAFEARDFGAATMRFQETLEAIDDEELTRTAPDADQIAKFYQIAEETRLVAATYESLPLIRGGKPRGLSDPDIRGYEPGDAAWPITFETGSAELTEKGQAAAEDLYVQMSYEDFPPIILIGYTDDRGGAVRNRLLSQRRAQAVADYLGSKNYPGRITVEGRGEEQPYEPSDASLYSDAELQQMSRRVDVRR